MDFLGVGPMELFFILLIALIVLGPKDIVKAARTMGRFLKKVINSPTWNAIKQTSREMRSLPSKLMQEAGVENEIKEFKEFNREVQDIKKISTSVNLKEMENKIKEPLQSLSNEVNLSVDNNSDNPLSGASDTVISSDQEKVDPHQSKNPLESGDSSIPERS